jgi:single-strand DNA-binding protein
MQLHLRGKEKMSKGSSQLVIITGNLGGDPELSDKTKTPCASFSLATTETYKNKDDEWVDETEWHNIVVWGDLADKVMKFLSKGKKAQVIGKNKTRNWENTDCGKKHYRTDVVARQVELLSPKDGDSQGGSGGGGGGYEDPGIGNSGDPDADIPF